MYSWLGTAPSVESYLIYGSQSFHLRPVPDPVPQTPHLNATRRENCKYGFSFLRRSRDTDGRKGATLFVSLLKFKKSGSESSLIAISPPYELRRKIIVVSLFYNEIKNVAYFIDLFRHKHQVILLFLLRRSRWNYW